MSDALFVEPVEKKTYKMLGTHVRSSFKAMISTVVLHNQSVRTEFIFLANLITYFVNICNIYESEGSGSVVECSTRDRGAAGSSLTGVTALCP